ncbi:prephenate dehydratase [Coleofasciculus sp. FACHB-64]|uniref:prephenate dehydratase n=1 Tax=Cyanophyceae TaxID=3028117 RepID=UPI0016889A83|nr:MULTISPECIES: prephenate dehydratase [unclassified Coleofasciculus]MBD1841615.1 prephenate dehydratase [Coleofasciculus sp. FACHB-501]MBD2049042.1 prephenate dehydratase [Coleofasciculus sp. FACHB-64]MBD2537499.1 prephenate dehydratase [Coleofasciculus sp. FACHB-SPT36]
MVVSVAHLGPPGTYAEAAALAYVSWLTQMGKEALLCPYPSIAQTLRAAAQGQVDLAVVPVENSVEGSVTTTLDTLWQLDTLQIQQALVLPISHALMSRAPNLEAIQTVYSHPQALAQCQGWLERFLPQVQLVPTNATTEALQYLDEDKTAGAIASSRAAQLYNLPILVCPINDYVDNYTRFWVLSLQPATGGNCTSLAFSVPANVPGALAKLLQVFASRDINLSRIESRPTKRSLGDYLFFIDLEANTTEASVQSALEELSTYTETLKIFGSYSILPVGKL